jgi:hypothetical protein
MTDNRDKKYAEAAERDRRRIAYARAIATDWNSRITGEASAVMAVADAEQEELRAAKARAELQRDYANLRQQEAESALTEAREQLSRLRALADEWEKSSGLSSGFSYDRDGSHGAAVHQQPEGDA